MKIKLSNEIYDYLITNNQIVSKKINIKSIIKGKILIIEDNKVDEIREWALEKLPQVGFNHNYSLNKEGGMLQEIIDSFLA